jgi:hypothetical protein
MTIGTLLQLPQGVSFVQPDLIGLEITKGELRRLTKINPNDVFRPSALKNQKQRRRAKRGFLLRWQFFIKEVKETLLLSLIIAGVLYALVILPTIGSAIFLGVGLLIAISIAVIVGRLFWRQLAYPNTLKMLLDAVDKYHTIIQAVDNCDQQSEMNLPGRETAIAALQMLREDLVRALKIERISRERKKLSADYQELFVNNLANLQALEVNAPKGAYNSFCQQLLQIDLEVQSLVRKLQSPG